MDNEIKYTDEMKYLRAMYQAVFYGYVKEYNTDGTTKKRHYLGKKILKIMRNKYLT